MYPPSVNPGRWRSPSWMQRIAGSTTNILRLLVLSLAWAAGASAQFDSKSTLDCIPNGATSSGVFGPIGSQTCVSVLVAACCSQHAVAGGCSCSASQCSGSVTCGAIPRTVTPLIGSNGSVVPSAPFVVDQGSTTTFTVTPNAGFYAEVTGTCGGQLVGSSFTTQPVLADCTVIVNFLTQSCIAAGGGTGSVFIPGGNSQACVTQLVSYCCAQTATAGGCSCDANGQCSGSITCGSGTTPLFTVTPSSGPNGSISPSSPLVVSNGSTRTFTLTPNAGYASSVTGTCSGTLTNNSFVTRPIHGNCTVVASFSRILFADSFE